METLGQFIVIGWAVLNVLMLGCIVLGSAMEPEPPDSPKPQPGPEGILPPGGPTPSE